MVQDAVAIEKRGRPAPPIGDFALRRRQIGRVDIDKIAVIGATEQPALLGEARQHIAFERALRPELRRDLAAQGIDAAADQPGPWSQWGFGEAADMRAL